ncbi:MAG: TfoX/Sxy family protein [Acidobacteria bacterium]|nr:TfoX/Sxy family protein [Acidobacteriota bacterium]
MSGTPLRIGPKSTAWMRAAGVRSLEDLERLGAVEAWRRAKTVHPREVSLNLLWALQGLLMGCAWNEIPPGVKEALRREAGL